MLFRSFFHTINKLATSFWSIGRPKSFMGDGEKLHHGKLRDASENHREKYSEESFCLKRLLDFFSMITIYQKLSDGHENSSGGMRFFDRCEMACGGGRDSFLKAIHR